MSDNTEVTVEVVSPGPTELDTAVSEFISATEAEYRAEDLSPDVTESGTPPLQVEGEPSQAPASGEPATVPDPALVQTQTSTAAEVVKALEESRAKARVEKEARKAAKRAKAESDKRTSAPADEIEALQRLGYDPDTIVRKILARKLGEKAPPELREAIEKSETRAQIQALEQKVMAQSRDMAARQYFETVAAGAKDFIGTGAYSKDAPTVADVAKRDPSRVHAEVMQEIISDARARAHSEPNGDVMSYTTAISRVEKRWAEYRQLFSPPATSPGDASTIQNSPQQVMEKKPAPKAIKPPDRPLAPWLQRAPVAEEGIRAAIDEFRRVENTKPQK